LADLLRRLRQRIDTRDGDLDIFASAASKAQTPQSELMTMKSPDLTPPVGAVSVTVWPG
jgi:hypothetical protein